MKARPKLTALAESLPASVPFVGPEAQERARGTRFSARLGANELSLGPSPQATAAMQQAATEVWKYADPENFDLRQALAIEHGVSIENVVVGEGIDGLLGYLARLMIEPGTPVVTSLGAYPTFNYHVAGFGGELHTVPYVDDHEDPSSLLEKANEVQAAMVYLANPDNPMGTWHTAERLQRMIDALPDQTLLVLDEAYIEFAPEGTAPPIDVSRPNVIRMRTFSKAYGMAGARIGYALGHQSLIQAFEKVRNHFGVNKIAQVGALAALHDRQHLETTLQRVQASKTRIAHWAEQQGWTAIPSATNFVTIDLGGSGDDARAMVAKLSAQGVFVRMPFVAPQDRCIRVSAGTSAELDDLEAATV